ncbi:hypothetical protein PV11_05376 [Exophiala sideris]|uniref:RING-type domain-containing protein n=1 Tax=Exophiala sideris TaxID=1016849 RepID=A0A0D1Z9A0_9EURO|nr:hypothetical protein PV11_05376 [Exophiala sideris]
MLTVDQLCRDIGIKNPSDRSTCIGYGQKKPTCGMAVAERSRSAAKARLRKICQLVEEDGSITEEIADDLESVATLLHCKNFHRDQAPAKAEEWERSLEDVIARRVAERRRRATRAREEPRRQNINTPAAPNVSGRSVMALHTDEDLLAELARRLASRNQLISTIEAVLEDHSRTYQQPRRSTPSHQRYQPAAPEVPVNDNSDDDFSGYYSEDTDEEDAPPGYSALYQPEITHPPMPQPRAQARSARSPSPSPSSASSSSRGSHSSDSSGNECAICLSGLGRRSEQWRCGTCRNATHMECFDQWMASSPEEHVRCIYCRSPVRTHD